jgi:pescadillo protein
MFAALPAKGRVTSDRTRACRELVAQWQFLLTQSSASASSGGSGGQGTLTKCFISVKGVYFQAAIQGVAVTWINPHEYVMNN